MVEIIHRRRTEESVTRYHEYEWADCPGAGFSFNVDEEDRIVVTDCNRENVELCRSGDPRIVDRGIREFRHAYTLPAVGRCSCGEEVELAHFTNTCDGCGRDYNASGQQLAPRSQWGEETGESLGDILRIP
jgi:hypothetical protein